MAVKKHGVHFDVTAENSTDRALNAVENNLKAINKAGDAIGRTLQGAFVATAAISAGKAFATAAIEAEQASKRLDAVLKATGHSAGLTKQELDDLADSLAEVTQFDDESLRNGEAQLLKFGNIHGDTFRNALKLSADLAAFMGTDLVSAVQAVGKALTSPTEGLGALERQVGKFDPAAKAAIETMAQMGQESKAQAAVLDVLKSKVGGAAEALNSGLAKSATNAKKQWDEMLESVGKTEPFQKVAKSGLSFIEQSFRDIKGIVENGDWVEKTLAVLAFAGGWRGMKLTPPAPPARNQTKGAIIGAPAAMSLDNELAGFPMSERDQKSFKEYLQLQEKAKADAKRQGEERTRENERIARLELDADEDLQKSITEAQEHWQKMRAENDKRAQEDNAEMWRQVFETIDREQEDAIEAGRIYLDGLESNARDASAAARELGMTFSSAFERAVMDGEKLSDVIKSLGKDLVGMATRKLVTEPLSNWFTGAMQGIGDKVAGAGSGPGGLFSGAAEWFSGLFKAEGGPVSAGEPYIVGERGPELMVPRMSGSIVPNRALAGAAAGGDMNVSVHVYGVSDPRSFRSASGQIGADLASALARARRNL